MTKDKTALLAKALLCAALLLPNDTYAQNAQQWNQAAPALPNVSDTAQTVAHEPTQPADEAPQPAINKYGRGIPTSQLSCEQVAARFELIQQQGAQQTRPQRKPLGQRLASGAWNGLKRGVASTATEVAVIGATIITAPAGGIGGDVVSGAIDGASSQSNDQEAQVNEIAGTMANISSRIEAIRALNNRNAELGCAAPDIGN